MLLFFPNMSILCNWMENFVLLQLPYLVCMYVYIYIYIYIFFFSHTFMYRRVHGRFYGLNLNGNSCLEEN